MSAPATAIPSRSSISPLTGTYGIVFVVGLLLVIVSLSASWVRFPVVWSNHHEHGFVAAAFCLWLVWRDRNELLGTSEGPTWWVLLPLVGVSMLWMVAVAISVQVVHLALVPYVLLFWLWAVRGQRAMLVALPIAIVFMLAVPVWEVLSAPLQQLTVLVNRFLLLFTGIKAEITGTEIHLPAGTIIVAASCSGINYLQSALTLGAMYSLVFVRAWPTRLKLVSVAAALALVSNWIRVFGLVIIGHITNMQSPMMQEHAVYGWVLFALTIPLFGFIAQRIEQHDRVDVTDNQVNTTTATVDTHIGSDNLSLAGPAAATLVALTGPLSLILLTATYSTKPLPDTPLGIRPSSAWTHSLSSESLWDPGVSGFSSHKRSWYINDSNTVQLDRYVYTSQAQGSEMISDGNKIAADSMVLGSRLVGPLDSNLRMVRETVIAKQGSRYLVWSWYAVGGIETPSDRKAQLLESWALITNTTPSETIVLTAPCDTTGCQAARSWLFEISTGTHAPINP